MRLPPVAPCVITALASIVLTLPAVAAPTADELAQRLATRFAGDRTGVCVQAATISPAGVVRGAFCAGTRRDAAPAANAAFEIGSVSKTMQAALVAALVAEGRWSLDDPIARHLPEGTTVPRQGERQITVRDLLTHRSALPPLPRMPPAPPDNPYSTLTPALLLAALGEAPLSRPIGSQFEYSNFGAMVLSLAIARAHGAASLEAVLRERLWQPLGMRDAQFNGAAAAGAPVAVGHEPGGKPAAAWTAHPQLGGVGMVRASLDDMVRYAQAHLGLLPGVPEAMSELLLATRRPLTPEMGMAWSVAQIGARMLRFHEGGTGGFSSLVMLDATNREAVVILADTALADLGGLGDVARSLMNLPGGRLEPRREVPLAAELRNAMVGEYRIQVPGLPQGLPIRLWADGDKLMAQAQGQGAFELRLDSRGEFYPVGLSARLRPQRDGERVNAFTWFQGGAALPAEREGSAPALTAQNPAWKDWAGEYALTPGFSLRVFEREGRLMLQGSGQAALAAEPAGSDAVEVKAVGAVLRFNREEGRVVSATLHQGGQATTGRKLP
jgi:serine-type D-Ala-D-Ala carboxypeptidase/endopeptidase